MKWKIWVFVSFLSISMVGNAQSEDVQKLTSEEVQKLAKDVQNPVSDLLRIGVLNTNWFGAGRNNYDF